MLGRVRWIVLIIGCVGFLLVGCGGGDGGSPSASSASGGAAAGSDAGDAKQALLAALTKMDGLHTFQAEMTMPPMEVGAGAPAMTSTSHIETSVDDDVVYQVTQVSGGPIGTSRQETLIRGSEYLMRSDLYGQAFGGGPDTWYRAPDSGQGPTMLVSMYFAPAAQAIDTVSRQGTANVRGTEVTVYRAKLDPAKFRAALSAGSIPGGIPADKLPAPATVDYGVGADGYVHSIALSITDPGSDTTIELHDFDTPLNLPNPTTIADMPR